MNPCVAHRGWSGAAPENTLAAVALAAKDPDIEMIEIDVQLSQDGVPVVIHDFTLDRTTNGTGRIKDHTLAELKRLDAGGWFNPTFQGEAIPTLEEMLQLTKGSKRLNIELKQSGNAYPLLEDKTVDLIRSYRMEEQVIVTSFDHRSMRKTKQLAPDLQVGLIVLGRPVLLLEQMAEAGASVLSIEYHYLTSELLEEVFAGRIDGRPLEIIAWTVNHQDDMAAVAALHPSVKICTNHPEIWKQLKDS